MSTLAFLTLEDRANFVIDDALAIAELARRDIEVDEIPWRRPAIDWRGYAGVVIRTPWDYQHDLPGFLALLDRIEGIGVPLANPASLVRWNAHKTYLRDLEAAGATIVPTQWGRGVSGEELRSLGGAGGVIKPVVGANADDTYRIAIDLDDTTAEMIVHRFLDREWMAQPFIDAVLTEGEHSLFYFGGRLSHAIVKQPKAGDFRVQEEHGGLILAAEPDPELRATADIVMHAVAARGAMPLQARVDLVRLADGKPALMELEAIEPSLYFRMHPDAPGNFADAIQAWLSAGG